MDTNRISKLFQVVTSAALLTVSSIIFPLSAQSEAPQLSNLDRRMTTDLAQSGQQSPGEPSGGRGGKPFQEEAPKNAVQVSAVYVWGGQFIDAMQFVWKDEQGARIEGKKWGGNKGGICIQLEINEGQYIKSITGKYGKTLESIVIERSDGYKVFCGGGGGKEAFSLVAPEGKAIWSFFGRYGDYLDALGVTMIDFPILREPDPRINPGPRINPNYR